MKTDFDEIKEQSYWNVRGQVLEQVRRLAYRPVTTPITENMVAIHQQVMVQSIKSRR